jgi:taurine dioxygenase
LFVSEGFTTAIDGWAAQPSEALLQRLYAHCTQPAFVYQHKWQEGDMVFWDNRCTLHLATGSREPRTLYRTTIKGDEVF